MSWEGGAPGSSGTEGQGPLILLLPSGGEQGGRGSLILLLLLGESKGTRGNGAQWKLLFLGRVSTSDSFASTSDSSDTGKVMFRF